VPKTIGFFVFTCQVTGNPVIFLDFYWGKHFVASLNINLLWRIFSSHDNNQVQFHQNNIGCQTTQHTDFMQSNLEISVDSWFISPSIWVKLSPTWSSVNVTASLWTSSSIYFAYAEISFAEIVSMLTLLLVICCWAYSSAFLCRKTVDSLLNQFIVLNGWVLIQIQNDSIFKITI
jgi:hypothetical protein